MCSLRLEGAAELVDDKTVARTQSCSTDWWCTAVISDLFYKGRWRHLVWYRDDRSISWSEWSFWPFLGGVRVAYFGSGAHVIHFDRKEGKRCSQGSFRICESLQLYHVAYFHCCPVHLFDRGLYLTWPQIHLRWLELSRNFWSSGSVLAFPALCCWSPIFVYDQRKSLESSEPVPQARGDTTDWMYRLSACIIVVSCCTISARSWSIALSLDSVSDTMTIPNIYTERKKDIIFKRGKSVPL